MGVHGAIEFDVGYRDCGVSGVGPRPLVIAVPDRVPVGKHQSGKRHERDKPQTKLDDLDHEADFLPPREGGLETSHCLGLGWDAIGRHLSCSPYQPGEYPAGNTIGIESEDRRIA